MEIIDYLHGSTVEPKLEEESVYDLMTTRLHVSANKMNLLSRQYIRRNRR